MRGGGSAAKHPLQFNIEILSIQKNVIFCFFSILITALFKILLCLCRKNARCMFDFVTTTYDINKGDWIEGDVSNPLLPGRGVKVHCVSVPCRKGFQWDLFLDTGRERVMQFYPRQGTKLNHPLRNLGIFLQRHPPPLPFPIFDARLVRVLTLYPLCSIHLDY